jgi:hypothetical protein
MATMQRVRGVEAVDVDLLGFSHERNLKPSGGSLFKPLLLDKVRFRLLARSARRDAAGRALPAQHLSIDLIQLLEMT